MLSADPSSRLFARGPSPRPSPRVSPRPSHASLQMAEAVAQPEHTEHIWIITGPAGCGKTTVARFLSSKLALPYVEGDNFHSDTNKAKMAANEPLSDSDRWDWLITLREQALKQLQTSNSVIVTCSALKHKYRDVIRVAAYEHPSVQIHFIYLKLDAKALLDRVLNRQGHFMKEGMVQSQLAVLEEPDEEWDVIPVDARGEFEDVHKNALAAVLQKMSEYPAPTELSQPQTFLKN